MTRSRATSVLIGGAILSVVGSGAARFVLAPALIQLPADLDRTVTLQGTASYADMTAIQSGDLFHSLRQRAPVTVNERVRVTKTEGATAVVQDQSTLLGPNGEQLRTTEHTFAVDRRTLLPAPPPPDTQAAPHQGLALGFPLVPQPHDYPFWDVVTQTAVTAAYQRTEEFSGHRTFVYLVRSSGPVKDPEILKTLPPGVPLALAATGETTFWVDRATSVILQVTEKQEIRAGLGIPMMTMFNLDAKFSPQTARDVLADAETARTELFLLRTAGPLALLAIGALLGAVAAWRITRSRRSTTTSRSGVRHDVERAHMEKTAAIGVSAPGSSGRRTREYPRD